jgi:hypothetical protein
MATNNVPKSLTTHNIVNYTTPTTASSTATNNSTSQSSSSTLALVLPHDIEHALLWRVFHLNEPVCISLSTNSVPFVCLT